MAPEDVTEKASRAPRLQGGRPRNPEAFRGRKAAEAGRAAALSVTSRGLSPRARERRVLVVILATVFLDAIGFGFVIPLLPVDAASMHAGEFAVGLILACFSGAQLLATPVLGALSDRHGRRRIILLSLAGNAAAMVLFATCGRPLAGHEATAPPAGELPGEGARGRRREKRQRPSTQWPRPRSRRASAGARRTRNSMRAQRNVWPRGCFGPATWISSAC